MRLLRSIPSSRRGTRDWPGRARSAHGADRWSARALTPSADLSPKHSETLADCRSRIPVGCQRPPCRSAGNAYFSRRPSEDMSIFGGAHEASGHLVFSPSKIAAAVGSKGSRRDKFVLMGRGTLDRGDVGTAAQGKKCFKYQRRCVKVIGMLYGLYVIVGAVAGSPGSAAFQNWSMSFRTCQDAAAGREIEEKHEKKSHHVAALSNRYLL